MLLHEPQEIKEVPRMLAEAGVRFLDRQGVVKGDERQRDQRNTAERQESIGRLRESVSGTGNSYLIWVELPYTRHERELRLAELFELFRLTEIAKCQDGTVYLMQP